jgi:hypothetical protein
MDMAHKPTLIYQTRIGHDPTEAGGGEKGSS